MELEQRTKSRTTDLLSIIGKWLIVLEIVSIVPLLAIALYNHPSMDDFYYGTLTAHAWSDSGSYFQLLKAAWQTVYDTYFAWQGTFSGIFVMAVQPSVFGEEWYPIGTALILACLFLGFLFLGRTLCRDYLQTGKGHAFLLSTTLFTFAIQLAPFPRQSYYWFNGSAYYSLFFGLSLLLWALVLNLRKMQDKPKIVLGTILACLLAFFIGGGNYVSAIQTTLVLGTIFAFQIVQKGKNILPIALVLLFLLSALLLSIVAPGNSLRQKEIPIHPSLLKATLLSLCQGGIYLFRWTNLYVLGMFTLLMPFILRSLTTNAFTFKKPWLLPLGSFLLFSAGFAPALYGMGTLPERVVNINFYLFVLLAFVNTYYFTGLLLKKRSTPLNLSPAKFLIVGAFLLLAAFVQKPDMAFKEAVQSLISGQAKQYDAEVTLRQKLFQDKTIKVVVVQPLTVKPWLLFIQDFDQDPKNWKNESAAGYYRKDAVLLKTGPCN